jgi:elongator complex protein 1
MGDLCSFVYLRELRSICLILSIGDIYLYELESRCMKCVGSIEIGVLAAQWSPDDELLVLITGRRTLLEMTKEFQVVREIPIDVHDLGLGK